MAPEAVQDWKIGAAFRFTKNPTGDRSSSFVHRVYSHPPCCGWSRQLKAQEVYVDFTQVYHVDAMYSSTKWMSVRFYPRSGGRAVWTNVRKYDSWWAALVQ